MTGPAKRNTPRELGAWGEQSARTYLEQQGFEILFQNVTTEYGEIDPIAWKDDHLHMVEVKTRRTRAFGYPEEAVTERKRRHIPESAQAFLQANPELRPDFQIDMVAIQVNAKRSYEITWFENAV